MTMNIYAGKLDDNCWEPVFDFETADVEVLADDADERYERGESAFVANPHYVKGAHMNLANGNAQTLFKALGFDLTGDGAEIPLSEARAAALKGLGDLSGEVCRPETVEKGAQGATIYHCGLEASRMKDYLMGILEMIHISQPKGATHLVVA